MEGARQNFKTHKIWTENDVWLKSEFFKLRVQLDDIYKKPILHGIKMVVN